MALAEQLTLSRAALEDTPHAAPPLVRLQSVSEIPVGFEFVRGHGRQGAVPTTPPRRKVTKGRSKPHCVRIKPHYLRTDRLHPVETTLMRIATAVSAASPNSRLAAIIGRDASVANAHVANPKRSSLSAS